MARRRLPQHQLLCRLLGVERTRYTHRKYYGSWPEPTESRGQSVSALPPKFRRIGDLAKKCRLPAIYPFRSYVEDGGGLMAYGVDFVELFHQTAHSIDKLLKGAKPGDIPYYQPTKFELVINQKAATARPNGNESGFRSPTKRASLEH